MLYPDNKIRDSFVNLQTGMFLHALQMKYSKNFSIWIVDLLFERTTQKIHTFFSQCG